MQRVLYQTRGAQVADVERPGFGPAKVVQIVCESPIAPRVEFTHVVRGAPVATLQSPVRLDVPVPVAALAAVIAAAPALIGSVVPAPLITATPATAGLVASVPIKTMMKITGSFTHSFIVYRYV